MLRGLTIRLFAKKAGGGGGGGALPADLEQRMAKAVDALKKE